jgi:hypothetical protein
MQGIQIAPALPYLFASILLVIVAWVALELQARLRLKTRCLAAFTRAYATSSPPPTFLMAWSYGEPQFHIRFQSTAHQSANAVANAAFTRAIDELCQGSGRKRRPFRAERAIFFTHPADATEAARVVHCCSLMQSQVDAEAAPSLLSHSMASGAYGLRVRDGDASAVRIWFCPWCGSKLPATGAEAAHVATRDTTSH